MLSCDVFWHIVLPDSRIQLPNPASTAVNRAENWSVGASHFSGGFETVLVVE